MPLPDATAGGPRRECRPSQIRSHHLFHSSEQWGDVPEPRIPCEQDPSGLGIPDTPRIPGHVQWTSGVSGPKTEVQDYADGVRQLMLAVHPLNPADCVPPSLQELAKMRRCKAVKQKLLEKRAARFTLSLPEVLRSSTQTLLAIVAWWQFRRLLAAPVSTAAPMLTGAAVGLLFRGYVAHWRGQRRRSVQCMKASSLQWFNTLRPLLMHNRLKPSQGPYWLALDSDEESCECVNTMLRKVWQFADPHFSEFLIKKINPILCNFKPPVFLSLELDSLQLGAQPPEIISMRPFSVSAQSIVLHAHIRLAGDGLYGFLRGRVSAGEVKAGVRDMRLSALARIEITEPMEQLPFFKAIIISFLEPLQPAFALKLSTVLPEALAKNVIKPALMSILSNEVFSRLFVWPNRLIIPMRAPWNPLIKPILPRIQPHIKGIVAISAIRAAGLPIEPGHQSVAGFSVDGLHWYKTCNSHHGPNPSWASVSCDGDSGSSGQAHLLIPLKELDLGLQIAIARSDIHAAHKWRDRDNPKIIARTTVHLHSLAEGEVLEGWHKLRPREAQLQDGMNLLADERRAWTPPWKKAGQKHQRQRARRLRSEFDDFQRSFCSALGEAPPPMPRPLVYSVLSSFPLPHVTNMGADGTESMSDDDEADGLPPGALTWQQAASIKLRAKARKVAAKLASPPTPPPPAGAASDDGRASGAGPAASQKQSSGHSCRLPWGGIYLSFVVLEARTLKTHFRAAQGGRAEIDAVAALSSILKSWKSEDRDAWQMGCLFVTVHEAHGLALWDEHSGFEPPPYTLGIPVSYDTHVRLKLASSSGEGHAVHCEERTSIVENNRSPQYTREFEFLAEPVSRTLEMQVGIDFNAGRGRFQHTVVGEVAVQLRDVARCPESKVWRGCLDITAPGHPRVVTGRLVVSMDWLPLNDCPVPPPLQLARLTSLRRGSLFVRVICAWDLAPMDVNSMTCNARVCMLAAGQERCSDTQEGLCPVWMCVQHFRDVSEAGELWLEVQHAGQFAPQSVARCRIDVRDLLHRPNEAVLVTKCLQGWDDDPDASKGSDLHWTARLGSAPTAATTASAPAASNCGRASAAPEAGAAPQSSTGSRARQASKFTRSRNFYSPSGISTLQEVFDSSQASAPRALRPAACHTGAVVHGTLISDVAPPDNTVASGWLMFEVAYRPYEDAHGGPVPTQDCTFSFPRVPKSKLLEESRRLHEARQAELRNTLQDQSAPLLAGGMGARKDLAVVSEAGNCLRVEVVRGENMPKTDFTGKSDPYVVLTAQSEAGLQMFRGRTAWATLNPSWNDTMDVWEAHSTGGTLEIQVWDDDMLRRDDHIGTEQIDVRRALLAPDGAGGFDDAGPRGAAASVPLEATPRCNAPPASLPEFVLSREVVVDLRGARHKRGMPRVVLQMTWVPVGMQPPWGAVREGRPLRPWRHTDLEAMEAVVDAGESTACLDCLPDFSTEGENDAAILLPCRNSRACLGHTVSSAPQFSMASEAHTVTTHAHGRRGRLSLVIEAAEGGASASRFPKYVTVRLNRARVGKTKSRLRCNYHHALAPMDNTSVHDMLVFKFKARGIQGILLGQATQPVRELVKDPDQEMHEVPFHVPLSGTRLALKVSLSWEPVRAYSAGAGPMLQQHPS